MEILTGGTSAQRVIFLGDTRSGKTTLMRAFLQSPGLDSVVVIDSKHAPEDWPALQQHGFVITSDPADVRRFPKVIFRVDFRSINDRAGWDKPGTYGFAWTEALQSILWRQNTLAVFDEAIHILPSSGAHPEARRLFIQGGGLGVPCWLGSQAPKYVDRLAMAQSEHLISFRQALTEYRQEIRERRGINAEVLAELGPYEWAHTEKGREDWELFEPFVAGENVRNVEIETDAEAIA